VHLIPYGLGVRAQGDASRGEGVYWVTKRPARHKLYRVRLSWYRLVIGCNTKWLARHKLYQVLLSWYRFVIGCNTKWLARHKMYRVSCHDTGLWLAAIQSDQPDTRCTESAVMILACDWLQYQVTSQTQAVQSTAVRTTPPALSGGSRRNPGVE